QFLAVAAQSDALIHIVDVSGGIDATGRIAQPGTGDPIADVGDIEEELAMWYLKLLEGNRDRISRAIRTGTDSIRAIAEVLRGIGVKEEHVRLAMNNNSMLSVEFDDYTAEKIKNFSWSLRVISKPTLILGNKIDLPFSADNFKRLRERYKDFLVIPSSADAELTLRRAVSRGLIGYNPGDERFEINKDEQLNDKQKWALNFIRRDILGEYLRTGVQFAINVAVFKLLSMNTVYPVADPKKLSDKHGNTLPDVYLMESGSTIEDLARTVHTDLAEGILYGVDARDGLHLPRNYIIKDRDILSIVSGKKRRKSATQSERR
ncbi:MAG TPA: TGS domain-containing protein, partial [Nitrososphaeraceae archaeon]|nr:TGS domain-containing protein [Nitrososphaeraceae archaeon]